MKGAFPILQDSTICEIKEAVDVFKSKMADIPVEDPKHKMMAKAMSSLQPVLDNPQADLDELLTLASMPMEAYLDKKYVLLTELHIKILTLLITFFTLQFSYNTSHFTVLTLHFSHYSSHIMLLTLQARSWCYRS